MVGALIWMTAERAAHAAPSAELALTAVFWSPTCHSHFQTRWVPAHAASPVSRLTTHGN